MASGAPAEAGSPRPRVVVFGATGRVGQLLVRRFDELGHDVLSVGRRKEALARLPGGHEVADLAEDPSGAGFLRAGDLVVNAAHARFTAAIARRCPEDIGRLVVLGSTRYLTRFPDAAAEEVREAARVLEAGALPFVLLHPTMIYGAAGENNVRRMAGLIRRFHLIPMPGGGRALIQPVHVLDVVEATVAAARTPGLERLAIHLGGPEAMPYRAFLEAIAEASGSWVRILPLPLPLVRLAARASGLVPGVPTVTDAEVLRLQEDKAVDISAMRERLGVEPRPLARGLAEMFGRGGPDGAGQAPS